VLVRCVSGGAEGGGGRRCYQSAARCKRLKDTKGKATCRSGRPVASHSALAVEGTVDGRGRAGEVVQKSGVTGAAGALAEKGTVVEGSERANG
jgi:hypothetical protein